MSKLVLKVIRLNIVIIASNQSSGVYRLLKTIAGLVRPEQMKLGITVVDDGSENTERDRLAVLKSKGVEILRNEHPRGWVFSVNRAIGNSNADWCWIIAADTVVDDKNSLKYIDAMTRQGPALILGHCRYRDESPLAQVLNLKVSRADKLSPDAAATPDCFVINREAVMSFSGFRSEFSLPELAMTGMMEELNQKWRSGKIAVSSGLSVSRVQAPELGCWLEACEKFGRIASDSLMPEYPLYYMRRRFHWLDQQYSDRFWLSPWKAMLQFGYHRKEWFIKLTQYPKMPLFGQWLILKILWALAFSAGTRGVASVASAADAKQRIKTSS
ncbi:glycosyltransferase family 2 protein [Gynuella sunshinyii]|nr:glycosyltransferase [Gynuella sunshinyii]